MKKVLNITNGDYFNAYFLEKFGGDAIPFRECMMDGEADPDIFSGKFIEKRGLSLDVTPEEYRKNMPLLETDLEEFDEIVLWFGCDTFCQMNLLTLLAYLEEKDCKKTITLWYIDDETFEIKGDKTEVTLGSYKALYEEILIKKNNPSSTGVITRMGVDLYFDYLSENGALAEAVRCNAEKSDMEIISILLEMSVDYGLSDTQATKILNRHKRR